MSCQHLINWLRANSETADVMLVAHLAHWIYKIQGGCDPGQGVLRSTHRPGISRLTRRTFQQRAVASIPGDIHRLIEEFASIKDEARVIRDRIGLSTYLPEICASALSEAFNGDRTQILTFINETVQFVLDGNRQHPDPEHIYFKHAYDRRDSIVFYATGYFAVATILMLKISTIEEVSRIPEWASAGYYVVNEYQRDELRYNITFDDTFGYVYPDNLIGGNLADGNYDIGMSYGYVSHLALHTTPDIRIPHFPALEELYMDTDSVRPEIKHLHNVTYLEMRANVIPPEVGLLHNATTYLGSLGFSPAIMNLLNLQVLELNEMNITNTDLEGLNNLRNLSNFGVRNCASLTSIPSQIAKLTKLKYLFITHNIHLENADETLLDNCIHLRLINISHNPLLNSIPRLSAALTELQFLELSSNALTRLPNGIEHVPRIGEFTASHNRITELPSLRNIGWDLDLSHNEITSFPQISNSIVDLKLNSNRISTLPRNFANLRNLNTVNLADNHLRVFPAALQHSQSIRNMRLDLRNNNFFALPGGMEAAEIIFVNSGVRLPENAQNVSILTEEEQQQAEQQAEQEAEQDIF